MSIFSSSTCIWHEYCKAKWAVPASSCDQVWWGCMHRHKHTHILTYSHRDIYKYTNCLTCSRNRRLNGVTTPVKLQAVRLRLMLLHTHTHTHPHTDASKHRRSYIQKAASLSFTAADSGRHARPAVSRHIHFVWNSQSLQQNCKFSWHCALSCHTLVCFYIISDFELCAFACKPLASLVYVMPSSSCLALCCHLVPICMLKWQMLHAKYVQHAACRMPLLRIALFCCCFACIVTDVIVCWFCCRCPSGGREREISFRRACFDYFLQCAMSSNVAQWLLSHYS